MNESQETIISNEHTSTSPVQKDPAQFEMYDRFVPKPAGFWTRFWAYLIDLIVISSITSIFVYPLFRIFEWDLQGTTWYAPIGIITSLIFYLYFVLMTLFLKQTVGKMIFGIRVISIKQDKLSFSTILFREWIARFFSATIWPLYWIIGFTPNKQGVHDFIADTMVINEQAFEKKTFRRVIATERSTELPETNSI